MIPPYIDCQNKELEVCEYFWHKDCPGTCYYATDLLPFCAKEGMVGDLEKRFEVKDE